VYNLFRRLEYTMDWVYFTVLNALKPEILTFSPEVFFLDAKSKRQITITGRNIESEALIMLRPRGVSAEETVDIRPLGITVKGDTALLTFDKKTIMPGDYTIYIRNPGGLEDSLGIFRILLHEDEEGRAAGARRPDIVVSAGYAPLMPLYGGLFTGDAFERAIFPLGFAARVGVLPLKRSWGDLGAELNASWHKMEEQKNNYRVTAHDIGAHLNVLYQVWLPNRIMALGFRLGAGINLVKDLYLDDGRQPLSSMYCSLDAGFSFRWHIKGPFFIEPGVDFIHILSFSDRSQPGYLMPALSLGWQF
jgi:hypothetical protein